MDFNRKQFKKRRKELRWTHAQLAKFCGVNTSTVSRWESGKYPPPESCIRILANVLNISVSEISSLSDDKENTLLEGIKELNTLRKTEKSGLLEEEAYFITKIKKQRKQIEKTTLIINSLLSSMHSAFYIKDNTNKYIIANSNFLIFCKLPEFSDVEGKNDDYFFPKNEAAQNKKTDQNVLALKGDIINEQMYIPGTQKKHWGLVTKVPIRDKNGKVEGLLCTIKDITEEKKANELNEELRASIRNIQDVVWTGRTTDYKLNYASVNEASQSLLGLTQKEFLKGKWKNHVPPRYLKDIEVDLKDLKNNPQQVEYEYIHPQTGKTRWLQNRINSDGQRHFGIIRDITDQKQSEETKTLLDKLITKSPMPIWIAQLEKNAPPSYKYISDSVFELTGVSKENFLDKKIKYTDLIHPEDKDVIDKWAEKPSVPHVLQYRIKPKSGSKHKIIEEYIFANFDLDANPTYCSFTKDISLTINFQVINEISNLFKTFLSRLDQIYWIKEYDPHEKYLFVSENIQNLIGVPSRKMTTKTWFSHIHPEDIKEVQEAHNEAQKREFTKVFRVIHKDGETKWVKEFKSEMQTLAGKKVKFGMITDITNNKVQQQEGKTCEIF